MRNRKENHYFSSFISTYRNFKEKLTFLLYQFANDSMNKINISLKKKCKIIFVTKNFVFLRRKYFQPFGKIPYDKKNIYLEIPTGYFRIFYDIVKNI